MASIGLLDPYDAYIWRTHEHLILRRNSLAHLHRPPRHFRQPSPFEAWQPYVQALQAARKKSQEYHRRRQSESPKDDGHQKRSDMHGRFGGEIAFWSIVGLTVPAFVAWHYALHGLEEPFPVQDSALLWPFWNRHSQSNWLERALREHFLLAFTNLEKGHWWTLLTNAFSHREPKHYMTNVMSLLFIGEHLKDLPAMTTMHGLAVALGSALSGGFCWLLHESLRGKRRNVGCHGASAMVMGLGTVAVCMDWGDVRGVQLGASMMVNVAVDIVFINETTIGHAAHLGGAIFGAAYYWLFLRRRTQA